MKIALIQCPSWSILVPPYNLGLLSACLKNEGHKVFCYDFNIKLYRYCQFKERLSIADAEGRSQYWYNRDYVSKFIEKNNHYIEQLLEEVLRARPKIIGFSVCDTTRIFSEEMASRIKRRMPSIKVVFGGPTCFKNSWGIRLLDNPHIDAVCFQEGEKAFLALVRTMRGAGGDFGFCPGFAYRDKRGRIKDCGSRPLISNLNSLPIADFSGFDLRLYQEKGLPISTARGCINRCTFCNESTIWQQCRFRSPENIYEEIALNLYKHPGINYFFFNDSLINGNLKLLYKLCELIKSNRFKFFWGGQMSIRDDMDNGFLSKLCDAGLKFVSCGLETASPRLLKLMQKRFSISSAERIIRHMKKLGVRVSVNIVVGFPGETKKDILLTADFLKRNNEFIDGIYFHPLILVSGSLLYNNRHNYGIKLSTGNNQNNWFTKDKKNNLQIRLERLRFYRDYLGGKSHDPICLSEDSLADK